MKNMSLLIVVEWVYSSVKSQRKAMIWKTSVSEDEKEFAILLSAERNKLWPNKIQNSEEVVDLEAEQDRPSGPIPKPARRFYKKPDRQDLRQVSTNGNNLNAHGKTDYKRGEKLIEKEEPNDIRNERAKSILMVLPSLLIRLSLNYFQIDDSMLIDNSDIGPNLLMTSSRDVEGFCIGDDMAMRGFDESLNSVDVAIISEPRISEEVPNKVIDKFGFDYVYNVEVRGKLGGLQVLWKKNHTNLDVNRALEFPIRGVLPVLDSSLVDFLIVSPIDEEIRKILFDMKAFKSHETYGYQPYFSRLNGLW
ncbi:unnamed protein product [Dovyalis caffra]|uniref:Uncharacterized protein n=1 Tax=Dovyalis caffra TaxID=77055 RepID=A0AAV1REA1_9ROSI|nr:unnamed protein product [Dovyalis caffra]